MSLERLVIIWNKSSLPEIEYKYVFPVHNFEDWNNFEIQKTDIFFILSELSWGKTAPSDFLGLKIIREIRVIRKSRIPIILFSFFQNPQKSKHFFNPKFDILRTPSHYFHQLPCNWNKILNQEYPPLDPNTLHDINNHFFNLEGIIDEEFHDLKNKMVQDQEDFKTPLLLWKAVEEQINQSFGRIGLSLELPDVEPLEEIQKNVLADLNRLVEKQGNLVGGITLVNNYIGEIKRLLPPSEKLPIDATLERNIAWKVLFVDDDVGITKRVKRLFKEQKITCLTANNAEDAFEILREDEAKNEIAVLICDYRMLNADGTWQPIQGYNILQEVALNFSNELAMFSLTSFNKRTLLRIQKIHQMQVWAYAKEDVIDDEAGNHHGFNVFVEKVLEEGDKVFDLLSSQPPHKTWYEGWDKKFDRPLKEYYKLHRGGKDFETTNTKISIAATAFYQAIRKAKHEGIQPEGLPILGIQESIGKDKKRVVSEKERLEKFRIKLLGRRIAIALFHLLEMDKAQIYWSLKTGTYRKMITGENQNTINQFFTTYMALSPEKDIWGNLLPEERGWLKKLEKIS